MACAVLDPLNKLNELPLKNEATGQMSVETGSSGASGTSASLQVSVDGLLCLVDET